MRCGVVFVDDYSRCQCVFFCKKKSSVPALMRLYLLEVGTPALFGSHFVMSSNAIRQMRVHTDGGNELNSAAVEKLLLEFGS